MIKINHDDAYIIRKILEKSILSSHDNIDELHEELVIYQKICDEIEKNKKSIFGGNLEEYIKK